VVHLYFSEPVEVTFGAVRVFDVDGHRVDKGTIRRASGNREVVVNTPGIAEGSYTVTWRAVSADGHPVHGGFTFYAVHPSTISPVAVAGDSGAGRSVGWGFGVDRFVWFSSLMAIIGIAVVRRWVMGPAIEAASLAESGARSQFRRASARGMVVAWGLLAVAGLAALVFQSASVSGLGFADAIGLSVLRQVLTTTFGHLWLLQVSASLLLGLPVLALARRQRTFGMAPEVWLVLLALGLAGLAVIAALNGHARTLGHGSIGVPALAIHLLAVSVWVGGLGALVIGGGLAGRRLESGERRRLLAAALPRFSRVATWAVVFVVLTGTINSIIGLAHPSDLWKVTYGRVILAKIAVLVVALGLASRHRFVTPKRLAGEDEGAAASFGRTTALELGVLVGAVALAAGLVALVPGRSLALQASGAVAQEHRAGTYTIQLFVDPARTGTNDIHITFVNAQGLGAGEISAASASLSTGGGPGHPLSLRLISPGHFVATTNLSASRHVVVVSSGSGGPKAASTFHLTVHAKG
jgi:copper transport protein